MRPLKTLLLRALLVVMVLPVYTCGTGVPIRIRIDEFTIPLDLSTVVGGAQAALQADGVLPEGTQLPPLWPDSMPRVRKTIDISTQKTPVELSGDKYEDVDKFAGAIRRLELNEIVLRIDDNSTTIAVPELLFQIADQPDAADEDPLLWTTVGRIPGTSAPGVVEDMVFTFEEGGESFFANQLSDDARSFAMRFRGEFTYDTDLDPRAPEGAMTIRLVAVVTFFIDPVEGYKSLTGGGGSSDDSTATDETAGTEGDTAGEGDAGGDA